MGRRIDVEIPIDDVVPLSELPKGIQDKYFTTIRFDGHPNMKLMYKYHGISDKDEFIRVFGEM
jgi:hypothetical protein